MSEIRTEKTQSEWYSAAQVGITIWLNYSLADMPGTLLVNTLGRGRLPTLYRRATEPTMVKISATTVPKIKTKGLVRKIREVRARLAASRERNCATHTHPLTSLRSHLLPAQYSVRSCESVEAWHAHTKHVRPALLAWTHEPCPEHESVELEHMSSEAKHSVSEPTGGIGAGGGRGDWSCRFCTAVWTAG